MKINWLVRIKNKNFWIAFIPAMLLLVQVVASVFGFALDLGELGNKLLAVVNAAFGVPTAFFTELEQKISQFIWQHKRP